MIEVKKLDLDPLLRANRQTARQTEFWLGAINLGRASSSC